MRLQPAVSTRRRRGEPGGGEYFHNLLGHGTGGDDSVEGSDPARGEDDACCPFREDVGVDMREDDSVDLELQLGRTRLADARIVVAGAVDDRRTRGGCRHRQGATARRG